MRTRTRSVGRAVSYAAARSAASSRPTGRPRLRAARLAVPRGRIAMSTPVSAIPAATVRTVPSPPAATTRRAPEATARRACMVPGSAGVVSSQSGPA